VANDIRKRVQCELQINLISSSLFMAELSNLLLHEGLDGFYFFVMCCANSFDFVFNKDFNLVKATSHYVAKFVICCINLYFINKIWT